MAHSTARRVYRQGYEGYGWNCGLARLVSEEVADETSSHAQAVEDFLLPSVATPRSWWVASVRAMNLDLENTARSLVGNVMTFQTRGSLGFAGYLGSVGR
jgi:hypothetical protein